MHDYKSARRADGAARIRSEEPRLQLPLYMLALRELLGLEPVGGVYRALGLGGATRGLLRRRAHEDALPDGLYANDV